jgi:hypothetical protein
MVQNFSGFVNLPLPLPLPPAMAELTLNGAFIIQVEARSASGSCYFDRVAVAGRFSRSDLQAPPPSWFMPLKMAAWIQTRDRRQRRYSQEILYGAWVSQSHRGRRSSSSSANLPISSKSIALLSRSFASLCALSHSRSTQV